MEKFGWAGTYLLLAAAGLAALVTGAPAVQSVIGLHWVIAWAAFILIGGLLATYGVYKDYKYEAAGTLAVGVGATMYSAGLWVIVSISPNVPAHTAFFVTAIGWAAFARFLYINHVRHRLYQAIDANEHLEQDGH